MMCMYKHPACINKLYANYLLGCCRQTLLTITHVIGILLLCTKELLFLHQQIMCKSFCCGGCTLRRLAAL